MELLEYPATQKRAVELGMKYYYNGIACLRGHLYLRYANSGNCVQCQREKVAKIRENKRARSYENQEKAVYAAENGFRTYTSTDPCPHGHYEKYIYTNNCVACEKIKQGSDEHKIKTKWRRIFKLYKITEIDYIKILENQENKCAICGCDFSINKIGIHIDHCHKTNKVRGILCSKCNQALGLFNDSVDTMQLAIDYIRSNNK